MKKVIYIVLTLSVFCTASCGSKKHAKCDAYGNKSGQVENPDESQA